MRLNAILSRQVDDSLLQRLNIASYAQTYCVKVYDWVAHELTWPMEGDVATAVDVIELGTEALKILRCAEHILRMAALSERIYRGVLNNKNGATKIALSKLFV